LELRGPRRDHRAAARAALARARRVGGPAPLLASDRLRAAPSDHPDRARAAHCRVWAAPRDPLWPIHPVLALLALGPDQGASRWSRRRDSAGLAPLCNPAEKSAALVAVVLARPPARHRLPDLR